MKFTIEVEYNNELNFLDLTLIKRINKLRYKIYRKPTSTDMVIHASSYHPYVQKIAAFNSLTHRLATIPMERNDYIEELNIIKHIAIVNGYQPTLIDKLLHKQATNHKKSGDTKMKYISTFYSRRTALALVNDFKKRNIIISFRTNNNIGNLLRTKSRQPTTEKNRNI